MTFDDFISEVRANAGERTVMITGMTSALFGYAETANSTPILSICPLSSEGQALLVTEQAARDFFVTEE